MTSGRPDRNQELEKIVDDLDENVMGQREADDVPGKPSTRERTEEGVDGRADRLGLRFLAGHRMSVCGRHEVLDQIDYLHRRFHLREMSDPRQHLEAGVAAHVVGGVRMVDRDDRIAISPDRHHGQIRGHLSTG